MPTADQIVDGDFLFSSEDVTMTIGGSPVVFFSKTIRATEGLKKIEGTNSAGKVIRKGYIKSGYLSGSMDLKYPSVSGAKMPRAGTVFTMTIPEIQDDALNCIVVSPTANRSEDAEAMCSVDWDEIINPPVTVGS